jgi:hypothetical protein
MLLAFLGKSLRVCSVDTFKEVMQFALPHVAKYSSLAFSRTGRVVAIGGASDANESGFIRLVDVPTGQEIRQIGVHQGWVRSLAFSPDCRTLASGGGDSTILLWDLTSRSKNGKLTPLSLSASEIAALWFDLAADAAKVDSAIWKLASAPNDAVPWLKEKLLVVPVPLDKVAKLVAQLDSDNFATRQKAQQSLTDLGPAAEGALRKALEGQIALEVRQRLQQILDNRDKETIRTLRAVEALEQSGSAESWQVLQALSEQAPDPRVAAAARAAIRRHTIR